MRSYGAQKDESVVVSVGSTIFTDIVALLLLAGLGLGKGDLSGFGITWLLLKIALFAVVVVVGIRWLGKRLRCGHQRREPHGGGAGGPVPGVLGAELAGVKDRGAPLAGLAVNSVLPEGRVKEQVIFVGVCCSFRSSLLISACCWMCSLLAPSKFQFTALMLAGRSAARVWRPGQWSDVRLPAAADPDDVVAHDAEGAATLPRPSSVFRRGCSTRWCSMPCWR